MTSGPFEPSEPAAPPPPPDQPPVPPADATQSWPGPAVPYPPAAPRRLGPFIAAAVVALVALGAAGGYVVVGLAFAQNRIDSANTAYGTAVGHLNKLSDTVNSVKTQLNTTGVASTSTTSLQQGKSVVDQFVSSSQSAQAQIDSDDASLNTADAGLKANQWLTSLSRSRLDQASAKIGHLRAALAVARTITSDYVQIGAFFQSLYAASLDLDSLGTTSQASDITGAAAADQSLKTDIAKAIQLDRAPGLPPTLDTALVAIQSLANDFSQLLNAAAANDIASAQSAYAALQADAAKVQGTDFQSIGAQIDSYYQPLIDQYNAEIVKANKA